MLSPTSISTGTALHFYFPELSQNAFLTKASTTSKRSVISTGTSKRMAAAVAMQTHGVVLVVEAIWGE